MTSLTLRSVKGAPLTNTEIDTNFTNLDATISTKLDAATYTAADILLKLKTVDSSGSGLDADLLDGMTTATTNTASTVVVRDASGNFSAGTITAALLSGDIQLQATKTISFEGSIDDAYETILDVVNPTADRTILLPNISGTIVTSGDTGTVTNTMLAGSIANAKLANSAITIDGVSVALGSSISLLNANNTWAGTQTFPDNIFVLKDDSDNTKFATFQLSNISTGTTRSMIIPNETGVISTQTYVQSYVNTWIPAGVIVLWSGSSSAIPSGWSLCNGSSGTPDLRNKFVVGAGSSYGVGGTGGSTDSIVIEHNHSASSSVSDPGHRHIFGADDQVGSFGGYEVAAGFPYDARSQYGGGGVHLLTRNTANQNAGQATGISVSTAVSSTGSSGANANLPPYYALCYIMKL